MINLGYHEGLKVWRVQPDDRSDCFMLHMSKTAKAEDVIIEAELKLKQKNDAIEEAKKPKPLPDLAGELIAQLEMLLSVGAPVDWVKGGMKKVMDHLKTKGIEPEKDISNGKP